MPENGHAPRPARAFEPETARELAVRLKTLDGPLMPILHALQEEFGYVDPAAEPLVAEVLNITRAEVHGVVTFYKDFRRAPGAAHRIAHCRAEACQSVGGEQLAARSAFRLGIAPGETTPDGQVALDAVYCLGLCSVAPSAMVDGRLVGRLDQDKLDALLSGLGR